MARKVVIFGGGVAGLTVAHELVSRGLDVTLYEPHRLGGKSASQFDGDLPGEHGFRFFPGWYLHLTALLERIPEDPSAMTRDGARAGGFARSVADALLPVEHTWACFRDQVGYEARQIATQGAYAPEFFRGLFSLLHGVPGRELAAFAARSAPKLARFFLTPPARRHELFDSFSLGEYLDVAPDSAIGLALRRIPKALVAMDGFAGSATTFLNTSMLNQAPAWHALPIDRVLRGPTSRVWFEPWLESLKLLGAKFVSGEEAALHELAFADGKLVGATTRAGGRVDADAFVLALPIDALQAVLARSALPSSATSLQRVRELDLARHTSWMVGLQLYLGRETRWPVGHVFAVDSAYGITAIDQRKVWDYRYVEELARRDPPVRGLISAIVTQWTGGPLTPGGLAPPPPASLGSGAELVRHVVDQLARSRAPDHPGIPTFLFDVGDVLHARVDDGVTFGDVQTNATPMLVHPPGSWSTRPEATTAFDNLFLASDFVRNAADLATMEGACCAGTHAANAVLDKLGKAPDAVVHDLVEALEPPWLKRARSGFFRRVTSRFGGFARGFERLLQRYALEAPAALEVEQETRDLFGDLSHDNLSRLEDNGD